MTFVIRVCYRDRHGAGETITTPGQGVLVRIFEKGEGELHE